MKTFFLNALLLPSLVLLALAGAAFSPLVIGAARLAANRPARLTARNLIWLYGRACVWIIGRFAPLRTRALEHIRNAAPCIIVANHQSSLDLFLLGALPTPNLVMVVKSWPFRMPLYNWFMRLSGYLDSESLDHETLLRQGGEALASGASLIFFPEGTRSRDGRLGRFRSGAFKLAVDIGRPLVPFCLSGAGRLLPPGRYVLRDSAISVEALPPIDPVPYRELPAGHIALRRKVKGLLAEKLEALRSEQGSSGGHARHRSAP